MGDSIAANLFMLGYAWQRGRIPLSEAALLRAIEMNGVAVESNKKSFLWGRRAAVDVQRVEADRHACAGDRGADAAESGIGDRQARRVPDRLPGCRVCRPVRSSSSSRVRDREHALGLPGKTSG
jgi:hypothetical protein